MKVKTDLHLKTQGLSHFSPSPLRGEGLGVRVWSPDIALLKAICYKTVIKNIFLICLLLFSANICLANETLEIQMGNDYLITTDENVRTTFVSNPDIIALNPFFTIFNEKNVLLLHPEKIGKTCFTIFLDNTGVLFDVTVKPGKTQPDTKTQNRNVFEIMPLDAPPNVKQLNALPPLIKKGVK